MLVYFSAMVNVYFVIFGRKKYTIPCPPHQLKNEIKNQFNIDEPFHLQVVDKDLKAWTEVTQIEALPTNSFIRVSIGKNMSLFKQYNCIK